ncbi:MAG: hypothetical protein MUF23_10120 [Pirellula sp.]|jgi:hypothetical protein|nr:hypothetical protein [Pirellula sp.]
MTRNVSVGSEVDHDDQVVSHSLASHSLANASGWDWHEKRNFKIDR